MAKNTGKIWTKKKAAIYTRVSTSYQVDKDSLPLQRKLCKSFCETHELEYELFEDAGLSAKSEKRPAYQEMLRRIRAGEFSHLIVYKLDRISRNLLDFMGMYEELESLRITFISLNENFDTNSAMGKAMLAIMIIFAQMEREIDSERVLAVMIGRAENTRSEVNNGKGLWNGSRPPVGFRFDPEKMYPVPDEEEMKTLHLIFDMYESTMSTTVVARYLNKHNIPSKRGGKWTNKVICDIIKNRFYIGELSYNKRKSARGTMKPEEEWVIRPNNHPAVIDIDQFNRCNEIIRAHRTLKAKPNTKYVHIFSEVLRCHICGGGTSACKDKRRSNGILPTVYRCTAHCKDLEDGCENGTTISDLTLGSFIFPFIVNYYYCYKNFRTILGAEEPLRSLADALIDGIPYFGLSVDEESVKNIFATLSYCVLGRYKKTHLIKNSQIDEILKNDVLQEKIEKDIEKCKKAIDRLTDLFLYSPDIMTQDEYARKRKELLNQKEELEERIHNLQNNDRTEEIQQLESDEKMISAFLLKAGISQKERAISFDDLYKHVDHKQMKDFVRAIFERIGWEQGKVVLIIMKNGLVCQFHYKYLEDVRCPICRGVLGKTVGCRRRTLPIKEKSIGRIKMGDPNDTYEKSNIARCEECGAERGRWHHWGCSKEICPICKVPLVECEHGQLTIEES